MIDCIGAVVLFVFIETVLVLRSLPRTMRLRPWYCPPPAPRPADNRKRSPHCHPGH